MIKSASALPAAVMLALLGTSVPAHEIDPPPAEPVIQIALLLDTSNSMDGLINQARTQLWKLVNEFNRAKKDGMQPKLQVALYEYGNNNLAAGEGYVRMVLPLTTDLDLISEKLWSLKTNGGSEYCGQVIQNAANELAWSRDKRAYRAIFVAGNEPFTQGNVDFRSGCAAALGKGVIVNTIHCGSEQIGREGSWAEGAKAGEGKFLNIDQDRAVVAIATPHDNKLDELSRELNKTYIPFGKVGRVGALRQGAQDQAAAEQPASGGSYERAAAKASSSYDNSTWDLVDALREKKQSLASIPEADLPEAMRPMSQPERQAYVDAAGSNRAKIQKQIAELTTKRSEYLISEQKKVSGAAGADTLDSAITTAVREQMEAKSFKIAE